MANYFPKNLIAKVVEVKGTTVVVAFYHNTEKEVRVEYLQMGFATPLNCQAGDKGRMSYRYTPTSGQWLFSHEKVK